MTVRDHYIDTVMRPKWVIYWPNFVTQRIRIRCVKVKVILSLCLPNHHARKTYLFPN